MGLSPTPPSGPYAWWMSFPVATRAAIRSALISLGWTSATVFFTLYGSYQPPDGQVTLHGFLAWIPSHLFGAIVGLAAVAYRTHDGYNRAVKPTLTTVPNPDAK